MAETQIILLSPLTIVTEVNARTFHEGMTYTHPLRQDDAFAEVGITSHHLATLAQL